MNQHDVDRIGLVLILPSTDLDLHGGSRALFLSLLLVRSQAGPCLQRGISQIRLLFLFKV